MISRIFTIALILLSSIAVHAQEQVYELRTYELEFFKPAEMLHTYFEKALIPALNRQGVKQVGVFEETGEALPKKLYVLIAHKSIQAYVASKDVLEKDEQYQKDAKPYLTASQESMPFKRISTNLIQSTAGFPNLAKQEGATLFELRIYESANEDGLRRKVKMFNDSEFAIFKEVGLPIVFFGANIAGDQMPCLTYLLAFKDRAAHDAAWSKFGPHPEWQRITKLDEYKDSMNDITRVFLKPVVYSQL